MRGGGYLEPQRLRNGSKQKLSISLCLQGGGGEGDLTPIGFSDLKFEVSSNENETFSTYSTIISTFFDVNWMTSSLIIYA